MIKNILLKADRVIFQKPVHQPQHPLSPSTAFAGAQAQTRTADHDPSGGGRSRRDRTTTVVDGVQQRLLDPVQALPVFDFPAVGIGDEEPLDEAVAFEFHGGLVDAEAEDAEDAGDDPEEADAVAGSDHEERAPGRFGIGIGLGVFHGDRGGGWLGGGRSALGGTYRLGDIMRGVEDRRRPREASKWRWGR